MNTGVKLAFSGPAGVGKSTAAEYLARQYGGVVVSFASKLKRWAKRVGWDGEKDVRGRRLLQQLGQVVREYDEDTWVRIALEQLGWELDPAGNMVTMDDRLNVYVDDLRFPSEANVLRSAGFKLVRLAPFEPPRSEAWRDDVSEVALDHYHHDFQVVSSQGCLASFKQDLRYVWGGVEQEGVEDGLAE